MADATTDFTKNFPEKIAADPDAAKSANAVFLVKVTGEGGGTWTLDLKSDAPSVKEGEVGTPDCTLELAAEDWETISEDWTQATTLFMKGKIKATGNVMLAMQLQRIFG